MQNNKVESVLKECNAMPLRMGEIVIPILQSARLASMITSSLAMAVHSRFVLISFATLVSPPVAVISGKPRLWRCFWHSFNQEIVMC